MEEEWFIFLSPTNRNRPIQLDRKQTKDLDVISAQVAIINHLRAYFPQDTTNL
jgi:hypothetical protein